MTLRKAREWLIDSNCLCNLLIVSLAASSALAKVATCRWRSSFCLFPSMMRTSRSAVLASSLWILRESSIVDSWSVADEFGIGSFRPAPPLSNWCMRCSCRNNLDFNSSFSFNACSICSENLSNSFWDGMFTSLVLTRFGSRRLLPTRERSCMTVWKRSDICPATFFSSWAFLSCSFIVWKARGW